jgi:hypothetical protein
MVTATRGVASGAVTTRAILFRNDYSSAVKLAVTVVASSCDEGGGPWKTVGWYYVQPGETRYIFTSHNSVFSFYARALDDTAVWDTDPDVSGNWAYVDPVDNFDICRGIGIDVEDCWGCPPAYVGMRAVDLSRAAPDSSFTVRLTA